MKSGQTTLRNNLWQDVIFLVIFLGILYFAFLGVRPLFTPDEGRYAEISREMAESGNYITPYLNYIKYFEKPALFYWLGALAIKLGGANLWSIRSINAILGIFGCLLTYLTARKLYNRMTGLLAAIILGTNTLYFVMSNMVSLDLPVTVFLTGCLYSFLIGTTLPPGRARRLSFWSAALCAALAVLTKGLIGLVFPFLIISAWIALCGAWRELRYAYLPSSLLIFFIVATPWHWLVSQANPEFFYFYFIEQHFLRYINPSVGHYQPNWYFIPCLLIGLFPWTVFLLQAVIAALPRHFKEIKHNRIEMFWLLWAGLIFLFFSFSKSKLIPYILPVFPPLAMLIARYLHQAWRDKWSKGSMAGFIGFAILAPIIAYSLYRFTYTPELPNPIQARIIFTFAGLVLSIGSFLSLGLAFKKRFNAVAVLILTIWIFLLASMAGIPTIETRNILPLAQSIKPLLKPEDEVITFNQYYQDLPFYLARRVTILNWQNEMSYGMAHQDTHDWMINNKTFWQRWDSPRRLYVVLSVESYKNLKKSFPERKYFILDTFTHNIVISNRPLPP
jgi:4-amino-4-deoxy-L-arabinose transferase-like glycosyltransferase